MLALECDLGSLIIEEALSTFFFKLRNVFQKPEDLSIKLLLLDGWEGFIKFVPMNQKVGLESAQTWDNIFVTLGFVLDEFIDLLFNFPFKLRVLFKQSQIEVVAMNEDLQDSN